MERDVYRTRLLQCKGKRSVRCTEKECKGTSLNTGDVFILDLGLKLFQWNGPDANKYEKAKAAEMTMKLHNERGAKGEVVIVDEDPKNEEFWTALGGFMEVTDPGEDDEKASASLADIKLHHINDEGGITIEEVPRNAKGQYTRDMLLTGDAYILDVTDTVFVWTGKGASKEEKKESMNIATKFIADSGRPTCE